MTYFVIWEDYGFNALYLINTTDLYGYANAKKVFNKNNGRWVLPDNVFNTSNSICATAVNKNDFSKPWCFNVNYNSNDIMK